MLSRPMVKAGVLEIELQNDGEDPHDLRVRRVGGTHTFSIPLTQPGKRRTLAIHVRPRPLPALVLGRRPPPRSACRAVLRVR